MYIYTNIMRRVLRVALGGRRSGSGRGALLNGCLKKHLEEGPGVNIYKDI